MQGSSSHGTEVCIQERCDESIRGANGGVAMRSDPENKDTYQRQSIVIVPADTPGVKVVRPCHIMGQDDAPEG